MLYQMLTGELPFTGATPFEVQQRILHHNPRPLREIDPKVPLDLAIICERCLEKDPQRRLHSCRELADCLSDYLANRPITIRPVTQLERAWRWCQRNPLVAGLGVGLVAATIAAIWFGVAALRSEKVAIQQKVIADERAVDVARRSRITELENVATLSTEFATYNPDLAALLVADATEQLLALGAPISAGTHQRLRAAIQHVPGWPLPGDFYAFGPGGRWLASAQRVAHVFLWDLNAADPTLTPARKWPIPKGLLVGSLAISADGNWLLAQTELVALLWRIEPSDGADAPLAFFAHSADFSPDSSRLATLTPHGTIHLYDLDLPLDRTMAAFPSSAGLRRHWSTLRTTQQMNAHDFLFPFTSRHSLQRRHIDLEWEREAEYRDTGNGPFRDAHIAFNGTGSKLLLTECRVNEVNLRALARELVALIELNSPQGQSALPWKRSFKAILSQDKRHLLIDDDDATVILYSLDAPLWTKIQTLPRVAVQDIRVITAFEQRLDDVPADAVFLQLYDDLREGWISFPMGATLQQTTRQFVGSRISHRPFFDSFPAEHGSGVPDEALPVELGALLSLVAGGVPRATLPMSKEQDTVPKGSPFPASKPVDYGTSRHLMEARSIVSWRSRFAEYDVNMPERRRRSIESTVWSTFSRKPSDDDLPLGWIVCEDRLYSVHNDSGKSAVTIRETARFDGLISFGAALFSPNGRWLAVNESGGARLLDLYVDPIWHTSVVLPGRQALAFSPDSRVLLTCAGQDVDDGSASGLRLHHIPRDSKDQWHVVPKVEDLPVLVRPLYALDGNARWQRDSDARGWRHTPAGIEERFEGQGVNSYLWRPGRVLGIEFVSKIEYPVVTFGTLRFDLETDDPLTTGVATASLTHVLDRSDHPDLPLISVNAVENRTRDWAIHKGRTAIHRRRLRPDLPESIDHTWKISKHPREVSLAPDESWALVRCVEGCIVVDLAAESSADATYELPTSGYFSECLVSRDGGVIGVESNSPRDGLKTLTLRRWTVRREKGMLKVVEEPSLAFEKQRRGRDIPYLASGGHSGIVVVLEGQAYDDEPPSDGGAVGRGEIQLTIVGNGPPSIVTGSRRLTARESWAFNTDPWIKFVIPTSQERVQLVCGLGGRLFKADFSLNGPRTEFHPLEVPQPALQQNVVYGYGVEFSPDGRWLALSNTATWIWDVQQPASWPVLVSNDERIIGFSADSRWLVVGDYIAPPTLISLDFARLIANARRLAGRELTELERKTFGLDEADAAVVP